MTTVAELIEQLKNLPPDAYVFAWDGADSCPEVEPARVTAGYTYPPGSFGSQVELDGAYCVVGSNGYISWHHLDPDTRERITSSDP